MLSEVKAIVTNIIPEATSLLLFKSFLNICVGFKNLFDLKGISAKSEFKPTSRLQVNLLKKILPKVKNIGAVYNSSEDNSVALMNRVRPLCERLGLNIIERPVTNTSEVTASTTALVGKVDAIYVTTDNSNYEQISEVYANMYNSTAFANCKSEYIFDVTNTSTHKVKFACKREAGTPLLSGVTNENQTHVTFIRLGDT